MDRRKFLVGLGASAAAAKIAIAAPAAPVEASPWLVCNGQALCRTTYQNLFNVLGTIYGADNELTFRLPDLTDAEMRGRLPDGRTFATEFVIRAEPDESDLFPVGYMIQRWGRTWP